MSTDGFTGSALSNPFGSGGLSDLSLLGRAADPPAALVTIYKAAARRYHVPWQVLAAINAIETNYGRNVSTSSAGAIGWMQFMPATWREYAVDATGDGRADPYNARDAIFSAAHLLAANGGTRHIRAAIFAYNHADWYVADVTFIAQEITGARMRPNASARTKLAAMRSTAELLNGTPYVWGGGHAGWGATSGYDCSGFVSAVLHAAGYLSVPVTTQTLASQSRIVSGPGRWVTIFDRTDGSSTSSDHVIIDLDGQWWESGGATAGGGAPRVHRISSVSAAYLATFNTVLHPQGL